MRGRDSRRRLRRSLALGAVIGFVLGGAAAAAPPDCGPGGVVPSPDAAGASQTWLRDVHVAGDGDVWAVGESFGEAGQLRAVTLHWDGVGWSEVPVSVPLDDFADFGTWAVGGVGDDVWAAGHRQHAPEGVEYAYFGNHLAIWRWDGEAWRLQATPELGGGSGDFVWGLHALAADDVWFVGDGHPGTGPGGAQPALALHWDGAAIALHEVPIVNPETGMDAGNPLYDVDGIASDDVWAVGGSDVTATGAADYSNIHHWDGARWTHVPGPTPGVYSSLHAVVAAGPDDVWAAGEYWEPGAVLPLLLHWDGAAWDEVAAPGGFLDMVAFAPDDVWAVGDAVYRFDGASWSTVETFPEVPYPALAGLSGPSPCALWAAGRRWEAETFHGLVVRVAGTASAAAVGTIFADGFESGDASAW